MATQGINTNEIQNYTQAISANITNLLAEVSRVSAIQTASPPPPTPNTTININNNGNFDELLRQLQNITSELAGLRRDVDSIKAQLGQDRSSSSTNDESSQRTTDITEPNLEELMELRDSPRKLNQPETAEEYNEIARRYNSGLRDFHEFLAPLHNGRNKPVFGFPGTVGELLKLNPTGEKLLCGAFGLQYVKEGHTFATFCGVGLPTSSNYEITGSNVTSFRVINRKKRALDIATAGDPTPETRRAAALHNSIAREQNAASDDSVMPLHDGRNLAIPGFPRKRFMVFYRAEGGCAVVYGGAWPGWRAEGVLGAVYGFHRRSEGYRGGRQGGMVVLVERMGSDGWDGIRWVGLGPSGGRGLAMEL